MKKYKKEYIFYIYILANKRNGTIYIGVTNNLFSRTFQYKLKENPTWRDLFHDME